MIRFLLVFLVGASAHANLQDIPFVHNFPKATEPLTVETFDFFGKLLGSARLAPHLDCELRADIRREVRKFSDRSEWVEFIDITYGTTAGYGGDMKVKFPMSSKLGRKRSSNKWSGVSEDVLIEAGDYYDHWIYFSHDGKGHIVGLQLGNNLSVLPCMVSRF